MYPLGPCSPFGASTTTSRRFGHDEDVSFEPQDEDWADGNEGGKPCPGARAVFRRGAAKIVLPQRCLRPQDRGRIKVQAQVRGYFGDGTGDGEDRTSESPRWVNRG